MSARVPAERIRRRRSAIYAEVTACLTQDPKLDASGIRVVVMGGSVTLNGSVLTAADKLAAEKDAAGVGAGHVTNNLIVG